MMSAGRLACGFRGELGLGFKASTRSTGSECEPHRRRAALICPSTFIGRSSKRNCPPPPPGHGSPAGHRRLPPLLPKPVLNAPYQTTTNPFIKFDCIRLISYSQAVPVRQEAAPAPSRPCRLLLVRRTTAVRSCRLLLLLRRRRRLRQHLFPVLILVKHVDVRQQPDDGARRAAALQVCGSGAAAARAAVGG